MSAVLDYILRTNLFNFIIFAGIIIFLIKKLDVKGGLQKGADSVKESVESSETAKKESEEKLLTIEDKVSNIESEIEEIISKSVENANIVGKQIVSDANKTAESIDENSKKQLENKTTLLKNDILKKVSDASVEIAKKHIINELNNNYDLHIRLIDESVEAINKEEVGNG